MADPLSTAASIFAVLGTCGKIIRYIREVKHGPGERTRLLAEMLSIRGILEPLMLTIKSAEEDSESWSATIRSLNLPGGALHLLHTTLASLHDDLARASSTKSARSLTKAALWPFTKLDVEERLRAIDRHKLLLTLALDNDHVALSREIQQDTRAIRDGVAALRFHVSALRTGLQQREEDQQRTTILNWLTDVDYVTQQHDFFSRRQDGTGQWFIESEVFKTWITTPRQTLFCSGIPGAGKTILTSIAVNHLASLGENQDIGLAYIYCNFRRQHSENLSSLLLSLLKQLSEGRRSIPDAVNALYDKHAVTRTRPAADDVSAALISVAASYARVYILVDALDECQSRGGCRSELLRRLFAAQSHSSINIFATSRPIPEISAAFQDAVSVEIRATPSDVTAYTESRLAFLPSFVARNLQLQEEIKTAIVTSVGGMYVPCAHPKGRPR